MIIDFDPVCKLNFTLQPNCNRNLKVFEPYIFVKTTATSTNPHTIDWYGTNSHLILSFLLDLQVFTPVRIYLLIAKVPTKVSFLCYQRQSEKKEKKTNIVSKSTSKINTAFHRAWANLTSHLSPLAMHSNVMHARNDCLFRCGSSVESKRCST